MWSKSGGSCRVNRSSSVVQERRDGALEKIGELIHSSPSILHAKGLSVCLFCVRQQRSSSDPVPVRAVTEALRSELHPYLGHAHGSEVFRNYCSDTSSLNCSYLHDFLILLCYNGSLVQQNQAAEHESAATGYIFRPRPEPLLAHDGVSLTTNAL